MRDQPAGGCPARTDQKDTPWDLHGSYHAPRAIQVYTRETPREKSKRKRVCGTTHDPTPPTRLLRASCGHTPHAQLRQRGGTPKCHSKPQRGAGVTTQATLTPTRGGRCQARRTLQGKGMVKPARFPHTRHKTQVNMGRSVDLTAGTRAARPRHGRSKNEPKKVGV